jgi:hypothetical protein
MKNVILATAATLALMTVATSAEATVQRVVVVETSDAAAYMSSIAKIRAAVTRLGSKSTIRVWRARYAGPDAGSIVVTVEFADMVTFAADEVKFQKDPEYLSLIKGLDQIRKIVSDSLYEELK